VTKTRLEAFSDGVLAIIITIMVLELRAPDSAEWVDIKPVLLKLGSYVLSFTLIAIYWGNHHHLLHTISHINSKIIWANMHLLFWLSLIPFATGWMGENHFDSISVAVYAALLSVCGVAYYVLLRVITSSPSHNKNLQQSLEKQSRKGILSMALYVTAIPLAFFQPIISCALFSVVAVIWMIPDRNIERALKQ
jgi:uncharacterized membrane protein